MGDLNREVTVAFSGIFVAGPEDHCPDLQLTASGGRLHSLMFVQADHPLPGSQLPRARSQIFVLGDVELVNVAAEIMARMTAEQRKEVTGRVTSIEVVTAMPPSLPNHFGNGRAAR